LIPALGIPSKEDYKWKGALSAGRITETPYVELLWSNLYDYGEKLYPLFVQLRNGPALPDTTDYIPEEIRVESVLLAEGDLLEWESKVKTLPRGTVIYHPNGSLASHYAVHAVLAKLPVLISRKPEIDEVLKPNTEVYEPDPQKIRTGFLLGCQTELEFTQAAFCMLVGCHSTAVWLGRQDILLGFAMGCCYRLTVTAALGEYRHEPGRKRKPGRNTVYKNVWKKILQSSTRTRYLKALESFNTDDRWPNSFGGKKWYRFGSYAGLIFNSILDGDIKSGLENLNKCVNAVHNSGWGFDKFLSKDVMDQTAISPSVTLLECAPTLYDAILRGESEAGTDWFKAKHHIEIEELDIPAAIRDEEREERDGSEENGLFEEESKENGFFFLEPKKLVEPITVKFKEPLMDNGKCFHSYVGDCGEMFGKIFSFVGFDHNTLEKTKKIYFTCCEKHIRYNGHDYMNDPIYTLLPELGEVSKPVEPLKSVEPEYELSYGGGPCNCPYNNPASNPCDIPSGMIFGYKSLSGHKYFTSCKKHAKEYLNGTISVKSGTYTLVKDVESKE
jgi:hypothetical protein